MFKKITVIPTAICIALIRIYHYTLSPWVGYHCRFAPSCSHYALQSFQRFGFFRGCWLTLRRIVRCHPWGGCGLDPVPEKK